MNRFLIQQTDLNNTSARTAKHFNFQFLLNLKTRLGAIAHQLCDHLVESLIHDTEPQISKRIDHSGQVRWVAYIPATGQQFSGSMSDMLIWVEQHYNR